MAMYKGIHGLSSKEVKNLYESCWRGKQLNFGSGWKNFDSFLLWAHETGYVKHARLRKIRSEKPYGPNNAFWDFPDTFGQEYPDGHPCNHCFREKECSVPCDARLKYWDDCMERIRNIMGVVK